MVVASPKSSIFRQEALEKTASPEQLDHLVQIVSPKRWISLVALGGLVSAGVAWSLLGKIPITIEGRGVLVYPSQIIPLQTSISGRIKTVEVSDGEVIKKGALIAKIDQTELRKQLELAENKLSQLIFQDQTAAVLQQQRESIENAVNTQQRQSLQSRLASERALPELVKQKTLASIEQERLAFEAQISQLQGLLPVYRTRWESRQAIAASGALSRDEILSAEREYKDIETQIGQIETQISQLNLKVADAEQTYIRSQSQLKELESQLKELESRGVSQAEQDALAKTNRRKEIQEAERAVAQLKTQLQETESILSSHDGHILELNIQPGQLLEPGLPVAVISQSLGQNQELRSVNFFPVSEGQKIKVGSELQATPSIVKREEYGGIRGTVSRVSAYQVTREGAAKLVGNPEILADVMGEGSHVAVFADLQKDKTESGFRWSSSKGPRQKIAPGVTTTVRITIEKRTPISFVLPILKDWVGLT